MRKFLIAAIAAGTMLFAGAVSASADVQTIDNTDLSWEVNEGVLTISGSGEIPDYANSDTQRPPWYNDRTQITTLNIDQNITKIGEYAFYNLTRLNKIDIHAKGELTLGKSAFNNCIKDSKIAGDIISIDAAGNVTIGENAFYACTKATGIKIQAKGDLTLNKAAFTTCEKAESIEIHIDGNLTIGNQAFYKCSAAKNAKLTAGGDITFSSNSQFYGNTSLESITIDSGKSVSLYSSCFYNGLTALTDLYIRGTGTVKLPNNIFGTAANPSSLKNIVIDGSTYDIAVTAFGNITSSNYTIWISDTSALPTKTDEDIKSRAKAFTKLQVPVSTEFTGEGDIAYYKNIDKPDGDYTTVKALIPDDGFRSVKGEITDSDDIIGVIVDAASLADCKDVIVIFE